MGSTSVRFLGSIISKEGRAIDPDKIAALKALQALLGSINFLRGHVVRFAHEVGPLLDVLREALDN